MCGRVAIIHYLPEKENVFRSCFNDDDEGSNVNDERICLVLLPRQRKLEESLLCSGQFKDALQALLEWLYQVEPTLLEDNPVNGDIDTVMNLMETHKVREEREDIRTREERHDEQLNIT